jgi:hypothetical protein
MRLSFGLNDALVLRTEFYQIGLTITPRPSLRLFQDVHFLFPLWLALSKPCSHFGVRGIFYISVWPPRSPSRLRIPSTLALSLKGGIYGGNGGTASVGWTLKVVSIGTWDDDQEILSGARSTDGIRFVEHCVHGISATLDGWASYFTLTLFQGDQLALGVHVKQALRPSPLSRAFASAFRADTYARSRCADDEHLAHPRCASRKYPPLKVAAAPLLSTPTPPFSRHS